MTKHEKKDEAIGILSSSLDVPYDLTSNGQDHVYLVVVLEGVGGDAGRVHHHGVPVFPVGDGPRVSFHEALQLHVSPQRRPDQLVGHVHLRRNCTGREGISVGVIHSSI